MTKLMNKIKNRKGFTLVEVIVVLVIIAILAAVLIPSLTGYIDRANEKALISECRSVVLAAQTVASDAYGSTAAKKTASNTNLKAWADKIVTLSEVKGTCTFEVTFKATAATAAGTLTGKVDKVIYQNNGKQVIYDATGYGEATAITAIAAGDGALRGAATITDMTDCVVTVVA